MLRRPWLMAGAAVAVFTAGLVLASVPTRAEEEETLDAPQELLDAFTDFVNDRPKTRDKVAAYVDGVIELGETILKDHPKATNVFDVCSTLVSMYANKGGWQKRIDFVKENLPRFAATERRWDWEELLGDVTLDYGYRVDATEKKDKAAAAKTYMKAAEIYLATRDAKEATPVAKNQARWNLGITYHWYLEDLKSAKVHWEDYLANAGEEVTQQVVSVTTNLASCWDDAGEPAKGDEAVMKLYKRAEKSPMAGQIEQTIAQRYMNVADGENAVVWINKALARMAANDRNRRGLEALAKQAALLGKPVPAFATTKWINSEISSSEALVGKIYLVEFWAVW